MISDFVEHLKWELRTILFENETPGENNIHPELGDQVEKFMKRYRCVLLPSFVLRSDGATDEECNAAKARYFSINVEMKRAQLEALELLSPLLQLALGIAASGKLPQISLPVRAILDASDDELRSQPFEGALRARRIRFFPFAFFL
jgi:hypothetical protein